MKALIGLVFILIGTQALAQNNLGTIHFSGNIVESTCMVNSINDIHCYEKGKEVINPTHIYQKNEVAVSEHEVIVSLRYY